MRARPAVERDLHGRLAFDATHPLDNSHWDFKDAVVQFSPTLPMNLIDVPPFLNNKRLIPTRLVGSSFSGCQLAPLTLLSARISCDGRPCTGGSGDRVRCCVPL